MGAGGRWLAGVRLAAFGVGEARGAGAGPEGAAWLSGCASGSSLARDGWTRAPLRQESASLRGRLSARLWVGAGSDGSPADFSGRSRDPVGAA